MMYQAFPTSPLASLEIRDELSQPVTQDSIDQSQIQAEEEDRHHDDDRRTEHFLSVRPRHFFHFAADIEVKLLTAFRPLFNFLCRIHLINKVWQARRDSNPQHPVLETGALPVGATGLHLSS